MSGFPLQIKATLMDAEVVEAGFKYYSDLLMMTSEEIDTFRTHYFKIHNLDNNILIEVNLRTSWTELVMDLSNWSIYLEDDEGNQHIPDTMIEHELQTFEFDDIIIEPFLNQTKPPSFKTHQKKILFYFSKNDYYGNPVLHDNIEYLKLVFLRTSGTQERAEGRWIFNHQIHSFSIYDKNVEFSSIL